MPYIIFCYLVIGVQTKQSIVRAFILSHIRWWVVLLFIAGAKTVLSQAVLKPETSFAYNWNVKIYVGKTQYYGDVSHDDKWEKLRAEAKLSMGAALTKSINPYFAVTADFFYTKLRSKKGFGNKPSPIQYYLSGTYYDFTVQPRIDFVNLIADSEIKNKFSVYFSIGLGYGIWSTTVEDVITGGIVGGEEGKWTGGLVIATGLALNYRFSKKISLFIDGQIRTITNDNLDYWVDSWQSDQLFVGNIGVSYNFNFKYHVKPADISHTKENEEYRKVIYE